MRRTIYPSDYAIDREMTNKVVVARLDKAENELVKTNRLPQGNREIVTGLIRAARHYLTDEVLSQFPMRREKLPEATYILYSNLIYMATVLDDLHLLIYAKHESAECKYNSFVAGVNHFDIRLEGLLQQQEKLYPYLCRAIMAFGLYMLFVDGRQKMLGFFLTVAAYIAHKSSNFYLPSLVRALCEESLITKLNYHDSPDPKERAKLKPGIQLTWRLMQENVIDPLLQQPSAKFYHPASSRRLTNREEQHYLNSYSSLDM